MKQRDKKIFEFIINFQMANHYWPSYSQIAKAFELSKAGVQLAIRRLEKEKKLIKPEGIDRAFQMVKE